MKRRIKNMMYVVNHRDNTNRIHHSYFYNKKILDPLEFKKIVFEVLMECTEEFHKNELSNTSFMVTFKFVTKMEERGFQSFTNSMELDVSDYMTYKELDETVKAIEEVGEDTYYD